MARQKGKGLAKGQMCPACKKKDRWVKLQRYMRYMCRNCSHVLVKERHKRR